MYHHLYLVDTGYCCVESGSTIDQGTSLSPLPYLMPYSKRSEYEYIHALTYCYTTLLPKNISEFRSKSSIGKGMVLGNMKQYHSVELQSGCYGPLYIKYTTFTPHSWLL